MNTKEAIEFLEEQRDMCPQYYIRKEYDSIIKSFKIGRLYQKIIKEIENNLVDKDGAFRYSWASRALGIMEEAEQRYFPEPKDKKKNKFVKEIEEIAGNLFIEKIEEKFQKFIEEIK